jgi:hypothetical protein
MKITSAEQLRARLEGRGERNNMRLFAQGYMERVIGWVRPAPHFVELRAGWDCADSDLKHAASPEEDQQ